MKNILFLSDIHYKGTNVVSEDMVINAFWKDLKMVFEGIEYNDRYCIIAGDLSCNGTYDNMQRFASGFHKHLTTIIPSKHIAYIPGNHDLNREYISNNKKLYEDEESKLLNCTEDEFDKEIDSSSLLSKFKFFNDFCKDDISIDGFNIIGYEHKISSDVSIYMLNTAVLSRGGLDGHIDTRTLRIQLSGLRSWVLKNEKRRKILVMHHPLQDLSEYAQREIEAMVNGEQIDFIISGHTHDYFNHPRTTDTGTKYITLPPLFESEKSLNGYMLMSIGTKQELLTLKYRQWSKYNNKFLVGSDLVGNDNGIKEYLPQDKAEDFITKTLHGSLQKSLSIYGLTPTWRNRVCIETPYSRDTENIIKFDYIDIMNMSHNVQIQAPRQFGLTCYARYLAFIAWNNYKIPYVYHNFKDLNIHKIEETINEDARFYKVSADNISCWLIDDWEESSRLCSMFLEKLTRIVPNLKIVFLTHFNEEQALEGTDSIASHDGFKQLYLQPMSKGVVREIVQECNASMQIASNDEVLERVLIDLQDMNEHRTPINCLQLMLAYRKQFEKRPINRYAVLRLVLQSLFDNTEQLVYGDTLDEDECTYILGHFVEYLFRRNCDDKFVFTEKEFVSVCEKFVINKYMTTKVTHLLQVLKDSQILSNKGTLYAETLQFRFVNWLYYFVAHQMKTDDTFFVYMVEQKKALYHPELMEYYTGIDKQSETVAKMINNELILAINKVKYSIGVPVNFDIYSALKWRISDSIRDKSQEELAKSLQESKLPESYKDAMDDESYDSVRPYIQDIGDVLDKYYVRNLMEIVKSAGRCLRNSYKINPSLKEQLLVNIVSGWREIMNVIVLLTPILANNGFGGIGGARFKLSKNFSRDIKECRQQIIIMIPYNIATWYLDDIFSDKLMALFSSYLKEQLLLFENPDNKIEVSQMEKHILALMIIKAQSTSWRDCIQEYIATIDKNSFYLGDLCNSLEHNYITQNMSEIGYRETLQLYKMCIAKHTTGVRRPTLSTIQNKKLKEKSLPRCQDDDE